MPVCASAIEQSYVRVRSGYASARQWQMDRCACLCDGVVSLLVGWIGVGFASANDSHVFTHTHAHGDAKAKSSKEPKRGRKRDTGEKMT